VLPFLLLVLPLHATLAPAQSANQAPAQSADQAPAQSADQAPAQSADQAPAQSADQAPAPLVAPELQSFVEAPYPSGIDRGEVHVTLQILVDEQGRVEQASVVAGEEPFRSLALDAVWQFRFAPATEGGAPTAVELPFDYVFPSPPVNVAGVAYQKGTTLPAANLSLSIGGRTVTTDAEGRFEVRNLAPGEQVAKVLDPVLEMDPVNFTVRPGERTDLELSVSRPEETHTLFGLYERRRPPTVRRSLNASEVRTTPGTLGDPVRAVQNLPGVVRTPLDAGWMLVRGGGPNDTGLYLDGIRVPLVFHLMGLTSVIHPSMIARVDFYPGATDVRYGRATSGVVDLVSNTAEHGQKEIRGGADLLLAGAYARVPIGEKSGFAAAVRRSWLDAALSGVAQVGLFGLQPGAEKIAPKFWDWQARFDREQWGLFAFGYSDSLNAPTGDSADDVAVYSVGTQRVHGRFTTNLGGQRLSVTPVVGMEWQDLGYGAYHDSRTKRMAGGRVELIDPGDTFVGWSAGLDNEGGRFVIEVNTEHHPDILHWGYYFSADPYADLRVGIDPSLTLGLRFEDLFVTDQLPRGWPSPRIQGRAQIAKIGKVGLGIFGAVGLYHQWPLLDDVIGLPAGPYLALERSISAEAGLRLSSPHVSFETDVFGRLLQNVTMDEDDGTLGQGDGRAYGLENILRFEGKGWNGWISYTYSRSFRREEKGHLFEPYIYDQPHFLVIVASRDLGRGWVLASRARYSSGYPIDPDINEGYDLLTQQTVCLSNAEPIAENGSCPELQPGARLAAFYAVDLKVSRVFTFRHWSLDTYLDIQNITNRRVPEPVITGTIAVGNPYAMGLPILPVFGLQGVVSW
jgi:TonB family protein